MALSGGCPKLRNEDDVQTTQLTLLSLLSLVMLIIMSPKVNNDYDDESLKIFQVLTRFLGRI